MSLQIRYKYAGAFYYLNYQNLPELLNKVNPSQNLSGFVFLWWITSFLSLEKPDLHKDPLGTLLSPRREAQETVQCRISSGRKHSLPLWLEEPTPVSMLFYMQWWWINTFICIFYTRLKRENSVNNEAVLSESPIKSFQTFKANKKIKGYVSELLECFCSSGKSTFASKCFNFLRMIWLISLLLWELVGVFSLCYWVS